MLTPREAVLNRNAAEMAGLGNIEKLNAEGNALARKGVDLASGGMTEVKEKIMKSKPKQSKPQSGSPYVQAFQKLMPKGGAPVGYQGGGGNVEPGMPGARNRDFPHPMAGLMHPPGGGDPIGGYGYQQEESDQKKAADKLAATLAGGNPYDDLNSQVVSPNYTGYGFAGQQSPYQFGGGYGGGQTTNVSDRLVPSLEGIRMQYLLRALGLGG
jgi:hypothetical protein